jgi:hypothetical protein
MKNLNDLKQQITDFKNFCDFIRNYQSIISTGRLSEYYCSLLFDIELNGNPNSPYDGVDKDNKKVEIKYRKSVSPTPRGMKIDLKAIDYVLYVSLDDDLLPNKIIRIDKEYITGTSNGRVSFKNALNNRKCKLIYER